MPPPLTAQIGLCWRPLAPFAGPVLPPLAPMEDDDDDEEDEPALTRSHSLPTLLPSQGRLTLTFRQRSTAPSPSVPWSPTPRALRPKRPRSIDDDDDDAGDRAQRRVEAADTDFRVTQRRNKVGAATRQSRRSPAKTRSA